MRVRASVELICNTEYYINEEHLFHSNSGQAIFWIAHYSSSAADSYLNMNVPSNQLTVLWNCIRQGLVLNSWVGMWHICALASVTQSPVRSIYPAERVQINQASQVRNVLNITIFPRIQNASLESCRVTWTRVGATHGLWQPNHFVPCLQNFQQGTSQSAARKTANRHESLTPKMTTNRNVPFDNKTLPQVNANKSKSSQAKEEFCIPLKTDHSDRKERNREKKNEYYRNKRANESQEEKFSRLKKRRLTEEEKKHKLKHALSPAEMFFKFVTGMAVLFCVFCLRFGYPPVRNDQRCAAPQKRCKIAVQLFCS